MTFCTVAEQVAEQPLYEAVIVAEPPLIPLTEPAETVATPVLLDDHDALAVTYCEAVCDPLV
jgi:hypothetical protein